MGWIGLSTTTWRGRDWRIEEAEAAVGDGGELGEELRRLLLLWWWVVGEEEEEM